MYSMYQKIAITYDVKNKKITTEAQKLIKQYNLLEADSSSSFDAIVILGGDGFALHSFHKFIDLNIPFYGVNYGTVGFLMNSAKTTNLLQQIENSVIIESSTLKAIVSTTEATYTRYAINEISFLRHTSQAAKIKISINGIERIAQMIGDGICISTPIGSAAYNFSLAGPILPLDSELLSIMPISPFRPKYWRGALIADNSTIEIESLERQKRPLNFSNDFNTIEHITYAKIALDKKKKIRLLFNQETSLSERMIREQFLM